MANDNEIGDAMLEANDIGTDGIDFDDIEKSLQTELEAQFDDLDFLEAERENINNPDNLGETVMNVVWEQFMNQVAATAGEDFIKENRGLTLDLSKDAHFQTTENFANGKIATHNTEINYQKRYDDWQSNFVKDENGNIVTHPTRTGTEEATLVKGARKPFDDGRPSGSSEKQTDIDHTISAAEIIRDPGINAHMTKEEQIAFANSEANLNEMDSSMNRSKGDKSMKDWLDNPNSSGKKPSEIFDITPEEEKKLREKDAKAREELERQKKEAEKRSIEAGKKSQRAEFYRIGKQALRTAIMSMLAALVKEIISKLVLWFKLANKNLNMLIEHIKMAIQSFVHKLKDLLIGTTDSVFTTIATAIIGPVVGTIKKTITLLKQGWKSLKEAIQYLRSPENRGKPLSDLIPQVGIIVVTGLSGIGAIALGEFIEKALMGFPFLAVDIPLLGSPANLIGTLMGAIVCGIIGAIAINLINKLIAKQQLLENTYSQIDKKNEVINTQRKLITVTEMKVDKKMGEVESNIKDRHEAAADIMRQSIKNRRSANERARALLDELDELFK